MSELKLGGVLIAHVPDDLAASILDIHRAGWVDGLAEGMNLTMERSDVDITRHWPNPDIVRRSIAIPGPLRAELQLVFRKR